MSRKYHEAILKGNSCCSTTIKSEFGEELLKNYGWTQGKLVGDSKNGLLDPIKAVYKDDYGGIGKETEIKDGWNNWWNNLYNDNISKTSFIDINCEEDYDEKITDTSDSNSSNDNNFIKAKPNVSKLNCYNNKSIFSFTGRQLLDYAHK